MRTGRRDYRSGRGQPHQPGDLAILLEPADLGRITPQTHDGRPHLAIAVPENRLGGPGARSQAPRAYEREAAGETFPIDPASG
jgi:hypothetical protein